MNKRNVFRLAAFSGITIGSFLAGISYERNRYLTKLNESENPYLLYAKSGIKKVTHILQANLISLYNILTEYFYSLRPDRVYPFLVQCLLPRLLCQK